MAWHAGAAPPVPLFDGKTLNGWVAEGPHPAFTASQGELRITGRGFPPNWIHTAREYEDFHLRFDYKLEQWAEAAVLLRAPRLGRPAQAGLSIYLAHDFHPDTPLYRTGAIAGSRSPKQKLPATFGVWHTAEITLIGGRIRAVIDGITVQDTTLDDDPELRQRHRRGFIGFPDYGHGYSLRNIVIEDTGAPTPFVEPLRAELQGWSLRGNGQWRLNGDGVLTGWGGDGIFYAPGDFADFELTVLVRTNQHVNSGVFLRGSPDPKASRGFEIQIYSPIDSVYPTGSIYNLVRSTITADYEQRWFLLQVRVERGRCRVRLDGVTVAESDRLPEGTMPRGRVGFQFHSMDGTVEFQDLRIRPL